MIYILGILTGITLCVFIFIAELYLLRTKNKTIVSKLEPIIKPTVVELDGETEEERANKTLKKLGL